MIESNFFINNINNIYINIKKRNFFIKKNYFLKFFCIKNKLLNLFFFIKNINLKKKLIKKKYKYYFIILKKIISNFIKKINDKLKKLLVKLPNLIHFTVPDKNLLIKTFKKKINKKKYKNSENYGIDFKLGIKLSGRGFVVLKEPIIKLYEAIKKFMIKIHKNEHNFKEIKIPYIINLNTIISSGQIPNFKNEVFFLKNYKNKCLIPTSEVPLVNIFKNKTLKINNLPLKLISFSSCFRKEKKAYGKKNKGLIRQLQFEKIELITIIEKKNSYKELIEIIKYAEKILKKLKIPYRIILLSKKETGITSCKTYDIETWLPILRSYIEVSSCSNTESFQSLRINLKFKKNNNFFLPHIINASGLAIDRTFLSVIENYQKKNFLKIPKCLKHFIKNKKKIKKI